jgi:probable HAF family extracellular repeat protein
MPCCRSRALAAAMLTVNSLCILCAPAGAGPYSIQGLGDPWGANELLFLLDVSNDGAVVGSIRPPGTFDLEPFRVTPGGQIDWLGHLTEVAHSWAWGISADGSIVVGDNDTGVNSGEAFRWTSGGGLDGLGFISGHEQSRAFDVSADGSVIVGFGNSGGDNQAFRWTSDDGMVGLGFLTDGATSEAYGVSSNGAFVVGSASAGDSEETFRWSSADGMVGLGVPDGTYFAVPYAVSDDGSAVVAFGLNYDTGHDRAFRWTSATDWVPLGPLPDGDSETVVPLKCMSADGSIVIVNGDLGPGFSSGPFAWTEALGLVRLHDYLAARGVTGLDDWTLYSAEAISDNGRTIVGTGLNPQGQPEAWIATIPEPSTLVLFGCGVFGVLLAAITKPRNRHR